MAGRDLNIRNYSLNDKNIDAYGSYASIAGCDPDVTSFDSLDNFFGLSHVVFDVGYRCGGIFLVPGS